jgi:hypothetical protein
MPGRGSRADLGQLRTPKQGIETDAITTKGKISLVFLTKKQNRRFLRPPNGAEKHQEPTISI